MKHLSTDKEAVNNSFAYKSCAHKKNIVVTLSLALEYCLLPAFNYPVDMNSMFKTHQFLNSPNNRTQWMEVII